MFGYKAQIIILFLASLLTACAGTKTGNEGRYQIAQDLAPDRLPLAQEMIDPTPIYEPPSRGGNRDYRVLGKDYKVLKSIEGFVEHGIASWYGKKFHGHLTSNGETYNMCDMSAAHKNLPLPTYVKVTNLESYIEYSQFNKRLSERLAKVHKKYNLLSKNNINFESIILAVFSHGSFMHLLGNMFALFIFGRYVEAKVGTAFYSFSYFRCGLYGFLIMCSFHF